MSNSYYILYSMYFFFFAGSFEVKVKFIHKLQGCLCPLGIWVHRYGVLIFSSISYILILFIISPFLYYMVCNCCWMKTAARLFYCAIQGKGMMVSTSLLFLNWHRERPGASSSCVVSSIINGDNFLPFSIHICCFLSCLYGCCCPCCRPCFWNMCTHIT